MKKVKKDKILSQNPILNFGIFFLVFLIVILLSFAGRQEHLSNTERRVKTPKASPQLTEVIRTQGTLSGLGFFNNTLYFALKSSKRLYKLVNSSPKALADLDFVQNMLFGRDGTIIAPVFNENRVVRILQEGIVVDFLQDVKSPTSVAKGNAYYFVSSFFENKVIKIKKDGTNPELLLDKLSGPVSLYYDSDTNTLYIANYNRPVLTIKKLSTFDPARTDIFFDGLSHIRTILTLYKGKVVVLASLQGKGVVALLDLDSIRYKLLLQTELPDPIFGVLTKNNIVYLASENDPLGRIFKLNLNPLLSPLQ